jgi:hypothetical protein
VGLSVAMGGYGNVLHSRNDASSYCVQCSVRKAFSPGNASPFRYRSR